MISKTFSVSFLLRKEKARKGTVSIPIYLRITINGQTTMFSTKRSIPEQYWDKALSRVLPANKELKELNNHLDMLISQINQAYSQLIQEGKPISVNALRRTLYGQGHGITVLQIITEHNQEFKALIGKKYSYGSYKNYLTTYNYIGDYIKDQYKRSDIALSEVDYRFGNEYYNYLMRSKPCTNNGAVKHLQRLKKVLNYAVSLGYIDRSPLQKLQLTMKTFHREYLNMNDLQILIETELSKESLVRTRDIFLFQCYTGLAYSDIQKLTTEHLSTGQDGELWLIIYRQKTNTRSPIPLLPQAVSLLHKYQQKHLPPSEGFRTIFPTISNQKMNSNLHKLKKATGLNVKLTTHTGRHTFATTITLAHGVPIETVSKMLGHTNLRTTQIYAQVVDSKIEHDMNKLKKLLS